MTTTTPNGIQVGQTVTHSDGTTRPVTGVVTAIEQAGLKVRISGLGYLVISTTCTVVEDPTVTRHTEASDAFPHVGTEMRWTTPDGRTTITVRRSHLAWTVETYQGTRRIGSQCGAYATEQEARGTARMWAEMAKARCAPMVAEPTMPAPAKRMTQVHPTSHIEARPAARGSLTRMTLAQARIIGQAGGDGATIVRGTGYGCASSTQLYAMQKRGWVTVVTEKMGRITILTGAVVTPLGARRAAEIIASNAA